MASYPEIEHPEFVQKYNAGSLVLSFNPSVPLNLAPRFNTSAESSIITVASLVSPWLPLITATVISLMQRNFWFLLACPITFLGQFIGSSFQRPIQKGCASVFVVFGVALTIYSVSFLPERLVLFFCMLSFLVAVLATCLTYSLANKAFFRKLLESKEFYDSARGQGLVWFAM